MFLTINNHKLEIVLVSNSSVDALIEILKQNDIIYSMDDYGAFEKVGFIGYTLPTNDTYISTEPGDIMLYQGNQICLFIDSNSWSYTRIGKINGYNSEELKSLIGFGKGKLEVKLSLK